MAWVVRLGRICLSKAFVVAGSFAIWASHAATNVFLTDVPDYEWHAGCFGTATGNLMGYWDRHGFPNFYTGPTHGGVAPLNSFDQNSGIRSLWASQAGVDGRLLDRPGHFDDYYVAYSSTAPDPYVAFGRAEHPPDCLGDFIGLNQMKWKNQNGECDGNMDGFAFVYWDPSGERRVNFTPEDGAGLPGQDIQSGLRAWTNFRGYSADVFTQLSDVNPETPAGSGFSFRDLKAEIDAGYPVLMFLQEPGAKSQAFGGLERVNPWIHAMLAYGYLVDEQGTPYVRLRDSFAGGDKILRRWNADAWWGDRLPLRGVIGYHPRPQITGISLAAGKVTIEWAGPNGETYDVETGTTRKLHWYVVERGASLMESDFVPVSDPVAEQRIIFSAIYPESAYYRVKLLPVTDAE